MDNEANREEAIVRLIDHRNEYTKRLRQHVDPNGPIVKTAFRAICDILYLFSRDLKEKRADLERLIYNPPQLVYDALGECLCELAFGEGSLDTAKGSQAVAIENEYSRRSLVSAYCKLIIRGLMPVDKMSLVARHYVTHFDTYGDIMKFTFGKIRELDKIACARMMALALQESYHQWVTSGTDEDSDEFHRAKELAKKFSSLFGVEKAISREAIAAIHRDGINFGIGKDVIDARKKKAPPNLKFLEIVMEFTPKLLSQDKMSVLTYLDKRIPSGLNLRDQEQWHPLFLYRHSLDQINDLESLAGLGAASVASATPSTQQARGTTKRGRPPKQKSPAHSDD